MGNGSSKPSSAQRRVTFANNQNGGINGQTHLDHRTDTFDSYDANPTSRETTKESLGQKIQIRAMETIDEDNSTTEVKEVTRVTRQSSPKVTPRVKQSPPGSPRTTTTTTTKTTVIQEQRQSSPKPRSPITTTVTSERKLSPQPTSSTRTRVTEYHEQTPNQKTPYQENNTTLHKENTFSRKTPVQKPHMSSDLWGIVSYKPPVREKTPSQSELGVDYYRSRPGYSRRSTRPVIHQHQDDDSIMSDSKINSFAARKQYGNMVTTRNREILASRQPKPELLYEEQNRPSYTIRPANSNQGRPAGSVHNSSVRATPKDAIDLRENNFFRGEEIPDNAGEYRPTRHMVSAEVYDNARERARSPLHEPDEEHNRMMSPEPVRSAIKSRGSIRLRVQSHDTPQTPTNKPLARPHRIQRPSRPKPNIRKIDDPPVYGVGALFHVEKPKPPPVENPIIPVTTYNNHKNVPKVTKVRKRKKSEPQNQYGQHEQAYEFRSQNVPKYEDQYGLGDLYIRSPYLHSFNDANPYMAEPLFNEEFREAPSRGNGIDTTTYEPSFFEPTSTDNVPKSRGNLQTPKRKLRNTAGRAYKVKPPILKRPVDVSRQQQGKGGTLQKRKPILRNTLNSRPVNSRSKSATSPERESEKYYNPYEYKHIGAKHNYRPYSDPEISTASTKRTRVTTAKRRLPRRQTGLRANSDQNGKSPHKPFNAKTYKPKVDEKKEKSAPRQNLPQKKTAQEITEPMKIFTYNSDGIPIRKSGRPSGSVYAPVPITWSKRNLHDNDDPVSITQPKPEANYSKVSYMTEPWSKKMPHGQDDPVDIMDPAIIDKSPSVLNNTSPRSKKPSSRPNDLFYTIDDEPNDERTPLRSKIEPWPMKTDHGPDDPVYKFEDEPKEREKVPTKKRTLHDQNDPVNLLEGEPEDNKKGTRPSPSGNTHRQTDPVNINEDGNLWNILSSGEPKPLYNTESKSPRNVPKYHINNLPQNLSPRNDKDYRDQPILHSYKEPNRGRDHPTSRSYKEPNSETDLQTNRSYIEPTNSINNKPYSGREAPSIRNGRSPRRTERYYTNHSPITAPSDLNDFYSSPRNERDAQATNSYDPPNNPRDSLAARDYNEPNGTRHPPVKETSAGNSKESPRIVERFYTNRSPVQPYSKSQNSFPSPTSEKEPSVTKNYPPLLKDHNGQISNRDPPTYRSYNEPSSNRDPPTNRSYNDPSSNRDPATNRSYNDPSSNRDPATNRSYNDPSSNRDPPTNRSYNDPSSNRDPPTNRSYKEPGSNRDPPTNRSYKEPGNNRDPPTNRSYKEASSNTDPPTKGQYNEPRSNRDPPTNRSYNEPSSNMDPGRNRSYKEASSNRDPPTYRSYKEPSSNRNFPTNRSYNEPSSSRDPPTNRSYKATNNATANVDIDRSIYNNFRGLNSDTNTSVQHYDNTPRKRDYKTQQAAKERAPYYFSREDIANQ